MLKSITSKTVFEKRWSMIAWFVGLLLTTVLIMLLFPTLRDTFGKALNDVPDSIKGILGDASTYQRINGFIDIQVLAQMVFMTIVYAIILFTGVIAGDENDGTLQTLLSNPVSRTRVYFEKLAGASILLFIVNASIFFGTWLGAAIVSESVDLPKLALACLMLYLVTFVFGIIGFALGAVTGKRGLAGALAGTLAFVSYLISNLAPTVDALKTVNKFSPYEYFNKPSILDNGVQMGDVLILVSISVVFIVIGYTVFTKRDISHK
jgi:ABC-2 type transport system permease protein